jgi:hypothetical protein
VAAELPDLEARLAALERPGRHERGRVLWLRDRFHVAGLVGRATPRHLAVGRATRAGERQWNDSKAARQKAVDWMTTMLRRPASDPEVQRLAREAVIDREVRRVLLDRPWDIRGPVRGLERLEAAHAGGRGVLLATVHFGLALNGLIRTARDFRPCYSMRAPRDVQRRGRKAQVMRQRWRHAERAGVRFVDRREAYPVLHALLARGEICLIAFDSGGRVETELAGQRTWLAGGLAALARDAGVAVVPTFTLREGAQQVGYFEEPIEPGGFGDAGELHRHIAHVTSRWMLDNLVQLYPRRLPTEPRRGRPDEGR